MPDPTNQNISHDLLHTTATPKDEPQLLGSVVSEGQGGIVHLAEVNGIEDHRSDLNREALILDLKGQVAAADFELEVLDLLKSKLNKSDLRKQTLFTKLSRAFDISDPEHGLLPSSKFDEPHNLYNLNENLVTIGKLYVVVGLPLLTSKFLGSYIPGNFLFDAAASYAAMFASTALTDQQSPKLKALGQISSFILLSPLIIPSVVIQGVKSIFGSVAGAVDRQSEVEEEAESKLNSMLSPIRAQKLTLDQRNDARNELRSAINQRIDEVNAKISPLREELDKMLKDDALDREVQDRLRELEARRIEDDRVSGAVEEAKNVLISGVRNGINIPEEIESNDPPSDTLLFSDLANFSKDELNEVYGALNDDNSFYALQNSASTRVGNLVSGLIQSFQGKELEIAKDHLSHALGIHLEVHS